MENTIQLLTGAAAAKWLNPDELRLQRIFFYFQLLVIQLVFICAKIVQVAII